MSSEIVAAVLAGGQSQRMGQDKTLLVWRGQTLLARTVETVSLVVPRVLVAGRSRPDSWPLPDIPFLPDARPGEGPLRGLEAALDFAKPAAVLAVACDLPLLSEDALRWLLDQSAQFSESEGIAVRSGGGRWEPLFSVYSPAGLPRMRDALARGQRSLHRLLETGNFAVIDAPSWVQAQLVNVNTPADLAALPE